MEALRSGEFKQLTGHLAQEEDGELSCCCLGVACEVIRRVEGESLLKRDVVGGRVYYDDGEHMVLPVLVKSWLGLESEAGGYGDMYLADGLRSRCLSNDNDGREYTFAQIADVIESAPEGLLA